MPHRLAQQEQRRQTALLVGLSVAIVASLAFSDYLSRSLFGVARLLAGQRPAGRWPGYPGRVAARVADHRLHRLPPGLRPAGRRQPRPRPAEHRRRHAGGPGRLGDHPADLGRHAAHPHPALTDHAAGRHHPDRRRRGHPLRRRRQPDRRRVPLARPGRLVPARRPGPGHRPARDAGPDRRRAPPLVPPHLARAPGPDVRRGGHHPAVRSPGLGPATVPDLPRRLGHRLSPGRARRGHGFAGGGGDRPAHRHGRRLAALQRHPRSHRPGADHPGVHPGAVLHLPGAAWPWPSRTASSVSSCAASS
jgi:hypothetical protein